jgi:hypothetical protein
MPRGSPHGGDASAAWDPADSDEGTLLSQAASTLYAAMLRWRAEGTRCAYPGNCLKELAMRTIHCVLFVLVLVACRQRALPGPVGAEGYLEGQVTIGPLQPVVREGETPTVPPEVYSSRFVAIFRVDGEALVAKVRINGEGRYRVALAPGTYVVDIARNGMDRADGLPRTIVIENRRTVQLNIDTDTVIR